VQTLTQTKQRVLNKDPDLAPAVKHLMDDANSVLTQGPWTVMDSKAMPPSGSKHDYYSLGIYWWPCNWNGGYFEYTYGEFPPELFAACNKTTGLPWVQRDGIVNPMTSGGDAAALNQMSNAVIKLSLAYYFSNDDKYAARAATLLKTWFFDESTKMNPNLNFGQAVPGIVDGRGEGLIETRINIQFCSAVELLQGSQAWTDAEDQQLKSWYSDFLTWMMTSTVGNEENSAKNNHGTWFDAQASSIALFTGKTSTASDIASAAGTKRVKSQIEVNGTLPEELRRTRSFWYSYFDTQAFFYLATLTPYSSVDLFNFSTPDSRSIHKALDFLVPYAIGEKTWPYQQIDAMDRSVFFEVFRTAANVWKNSQYETDIGKLPKVDYTGNYLVDLVYPKH